jgi:hypothetical protein
MQLNTLQCRFLGGHTSEASELSVGLVVNGLQQQAPLLQIIKHLLQDICAYFCPTATAAL